MGIPLTGLCDANFSANEMSYQNSLMIPTVIKNHYFIDSDCGSPHLSKGTPEKGYCNQLFKQC